MFIILIVLLVIASLFLLRMLWHSFYNVVYNTTGKVLGPNMYKTDYLRKLYYKRARGDFYEVGTIIFAHLWGFLGFSAFAFTAWAVDKVHPDRVEGLLLPIIFGVVFLLISYVSHLDDQYCSIK